MRYLRLVLRWIYEFFFGSPPPLVVQALPEEPERLIPLPPEIPAPIYHTRTIIRLGRSEMFRGGTEGTDLSRMV